MCRLNLLERLFKKAIVSEVAWKKVTVESDPSCEKVLKAGFIYVEKAGDRRLVALLEEFMGMSEAEATALALEL